MTEILNDDWIIDFEKKDLFFKEFYKDDIYYTNVHIVYINNNMEIVQIKEDTFLLSKSNIITREEIVGILKRKSCNNNKQYKLVSILKYNITLEPENVSKYLNGDYDAVKEYSFLEDIKHVDAIHFEKSISLFHDLTDIYCIFYEKSKEPKNNHNSTKKIVLTTKHKKTVRNLYKD